MTQVNERKSEMMSAKKVGVFAVITDEQRSKLVNPSETAFRGETLFVNERVEEPFSSPLGLFTVALIRADVGNDLMIETDFAGFERIKGAIGIEVRSGNRQSQALHPGKGILEMPLEVESVMMVARDDPGRSHDKALRVRNRQNVRGFGAFSVLVSDTFAPFFRQRVTPIEIQFRQIEVGLERLDALLPDPLKTAIATPFLEVMVDRLPANLFFSGSARAGAIGNCVH